MDVVNAYARAGHFRHSRPFLGSRGPAAPRASARWLSRILMTSTRSLDLLDWQAKPLCQLVGTGIEFLDRPPREADSSERQPQEVPAAA